MTSAELALLPVGAVVMLDDEAGEIVRSGAVVHIWWRDCTSVIDTKSKTWEYFINWLTA